MIVIFWELVRIAYLMQVFYWSKASECTAQIVQDLPFVCMFLTVVTAHDFMIDLYFRLSDRFGRVYYHLRKIYTLSTIIVLFGLFLIQNSYVCGVSN